MHVALSLRDQAFETTKSLGILNFSLGLSRGLLSDPRVDRLTVFSNRGLGAVAGRRGPRLAYTGRDAAAPAGLHRVAWDQWGLVAASDEAGADWLVLPKGYAPLARWPRARVCVCVQDDMAMRPVPTSAPLQRHLERPYFIAMLQQSLRRADLVVTTSRFNAQVLAKLCPTRRDIVPVGIGFDAVERTAAPPDGHILLLTSSHPHKLTAKAIDWLLRWDDGCADKRAIIGVGSLPSDVVWPQRAHWQHLPRAQPTQYEALLRGAAVLLYFSEYEGYGMPPREALLRGSWTLSCDLPPIREDVPEECLFPADCYPTFSSRLDSTLARVARGEMPAMPRLPSWRDVAARILTAMSAVERGS